MSDMANPLAAASLLLTVLTLVYTAWSVSIEAEVNRVYAANDAAKAKEVEAARKVRRWRALPLALASVLVLVLYLPRDFDILSSIRDYWAGSSSHYDDVAAIFILTQVFLFGLAWHLWAQWRRIGAKF